MAIKSGFITIESCIKSYLGDTYASNIEMFQRCMSWMLRFNNELGFDVIKKLKRKFLSVDSSTQTAILPDDFVQYTQIGLRTNNNEFVPLVQNDSIIVDYEVPECDKLSDHCDCGCDSEICYAFGESNAVTTYTSVVINGNTYQDSVTICTAENGDVTQRTCVHTVTNAVQTCTYAFPNDAITDSPFTDVTIRKNGIDIFVWDIANNTAWIALWVANGFTSGGGFYTKETTTDVWSYVTYIDVNGDTQTIEITQSSCTTPTPTVEELCYEEKICEVEVLPCGCVVPDDTAINVLCNCGQAFAFAVTSRARNNKNFGLSLIPSNGFFGEYKIDLNLGVIKFNSDFQYDTVFVEYYSSGEADSKDYLIPIQAEECAVAYMYFKSLQRKANADKWEKQMAQKTYYNEKRLLKQRLNPLNLDTFLSTQRVLPIRP